MSGLTQKSPAFNFIQMRPKRQDFGQGNFAAANDAAAVRVRHAQIGITRGAGGPFLHGRFCNRRKKIECRNFCIFLKKVFEF